MESDTEEVIEVVSGSIEDAEAECALWSQKVKKLEAEYAEAKSKYEAAKMKLKGLLEEKRISDNRKKIQGSDSTLQKDWIDRQFEWSQTILNVLKTKFKFDNFRSVQLAAINATLSKKDVILVMPTGGGKSLVYQLPAIVDKGLTIVVSPLISLIEDQLISLKNFDINAATINSSTPKDEVTKIYKQMTSKENSLKLLFVTPEMLGKSNRFMMNLKKAHEAGRISRLAVDEVHCCSTWGHDFRPDYKFLGLVRQTLTNVPFLGLTATATSAVIVDIQEVLSLNSDCMIITAPFNRPNLYYEVVSKPPSAEETLNYMRKLVQGKYANQSGIIYTNTIKDSVTVATELRSQGVAAAPYHAQLEPEQKKKIHEKWLTKKYQVVVATVAFGMGIDKPDVRFVIHHTVPRSMESLYQESGRAGRDGERAHCLILFSLTDYLKVLGNVSSVRQEKKAKAVLEYCLEQRSCRRSLISKHFDEVWNSSHCNNMCDNCAKTVNLYSYYVTDICRDIHEIIDSSKEQLTVNKLLDRWFKKAKKKSSGGATNMSKSKIETIVAFLLLKKFLAVDRGYTLYSTVCYIQQGTSVDQPIEMVTSETYSGIPKKAHFDEKSNEQPQKKAKK